MKNWFLNLLATMSMREALAITVLFTLALVALRQVLDVLARRERERDDVGRERRRRAQKKDE